MSFRHLQAANECHNEELKIAPRGSVTMNHLPKPERERERQTERKSGCWSIHLAPWWQHPSTPLSPPLYTLFSRRTGSGTVRVRDPRPITLSLPADLPYLGGLLLGGDRVRRKVGALFAAEKLQIEIYRRRRYAVEVYPEGAELLAPRFPLDAVRRLRALVADGSRPLARHRAVAAVAVAQVRVRHAAFD